MRAAVMRGPNNLVVDDVPDPVPGKGQILVKTLACGICGSDLHFLKYAKEMVKLGEEMTGGGPGIGGSIDLGKDLIMGHEFAAEVLEIGPDTQAGVKPGDAVVSLPVMVTDLTDLTSMQPIGAYSNTYGGGYAEYMLLSAMLATPIPNGLDARHAALTEPMAVGQHAVNKSGIKAGEAAVVLGAGPVGLACISALARMGVEPIVAADFSPARRALAKTMGAHEAVDPRDEPAIDAWNRVDGKKSMVIYEAVGVPGMLDQAMRSAPRAGRIMVVGACMENDLVRPLIGIGKELEIRFALGYDPMEFGGTLRAIAEGEIDVVPLITGEVGIDAVPKAFADLGNPDEHCKILVEPALDA
jgi:threonine dehydrogenase-like Zn-dependent dehydrogenase